MIMRITLETTVVKAQDVLIELKDSRRLEDALNEIDEKQPKTIEDYLDNLRKIGISSLEKSKETEEFTIVACTETEDI